jgi:hypothetical protein
MRKWSPRVLIVLAVVAAIGTSPAPAAAQAQRYGPTFGVGGTTAPVLSPDVAHDSMRDRFLVVSGNGFIEAHLLDGNGNRLAVFPVHDPRAYGGYSQTPRVAFGAGVNGGAGGYLVTWHEAVGPVAVVVGRMVSADGALITNPFTIALEAGAPGTGSNWTMGAAVAYSTTSNEFLVAWMGAYFTAQNIHFTRVNTVGAPLQSPVAITAGADWERDPSVAYSPHDNEFYIVYAGYREAATYGYVAGQRVQAGTGALIPSQSGELAQSFSTQMSAVAYNPATRQYVVSWYNLSAAGGATYGISIQASTGAPATAVRVMSAYYFAYDANDIEYNHATGDFLVVTHGRAPQEWEDAAISIRADGIPVDNGFVLTNTPDVRPVVAGDGNFNPRVTASSNSGRYLTVTASRFAAVHGQFATSAGGQPPPPPPPTQPQPRMYIDYPSNGATVSQNFAVAGWALDLSAPSGSGVAAVHVWAFPTAGGNPIFVGAANLNVPRPDIGNYYSNAQFAASGYGLLGALPPGEYDLRVSMLSTVAGTFNMAASTRILVTVPQSTPRMYVDNPAWNQDVPTGFWIAGWAVDLGAPTGSGVDGIHVWAYPSAGGNPVWVGEGALGGWRPDVGGYYGDPRFSSSGYFLQGSLPRGPYHLVVFAHSTVAGTFNQAAVIPITVR